ncbi:MAG: response regulator transcription factor [Candidatus Doudnabacteria bacterium]|nr:response regulator transcription factor [Candidatus Doudnabacteria bacterium]
MTVLLVEDEPGLVHFMRKGLESEYFTVDVCTDGESGLKAIEINGYDLVVLDIMLPKKDGIAVCQEMRDKGIHTPVLMVSVLDDVIDRIKGLNNGADDYLIKPFAFEEMLARMQALLRRERSVKHVKLQVGGLVLDPNTHEVKRDNDIVFLTRKEYCILDYLMRNIGKVCTRTMIGEKIWGYDFVQRSNTIDVHMSYLRKKIDKGHRDPLIHVMRDVGYKIQDYGNNKLRMAYDQAQGVIPISVDKQLNNA